MQYIMDVSMNFSTARSRLDQGKRIRRRSWPNKSLQVCAVPEGTTLPDAFEELGKMAAWAVYGSGECGPWVFSEEDKIRLDWEVVPFYEEHLIASSRDQQYSCIPSTYTGLAFTLVKQYNESVDSMRRAAYGLLEISARRYFSKSTQGDQVKVLDRIKKVFEANPSAAPYHNNYHAYSMVVNCAELYEGCAVVAVPQLHKVAPFQLLIAALFHDYAHSGGILSDAENITAACRLVTKEISPLLIVGDGEEVTRLIQITHFPFKREPVTLEEKIIRDADLLQITMPSYAYQVYKGLISEIRLSGAHKPRQTLLTLEGYAEAQHNFLTSATFYTNSLVTTNKRKVLAALSTKEAIATDLRLLQKAFPDMFGH